MGTKNSVYLIISWFIFWLISKSLNRKYSVLLSICSAIYNGWEEGSIFFHLIVFYH